jgi:hypothetical protein
MSSASIFRRVGESACNPKPKSLRQTGRTAFNLKHNDLANDRLNSCHPTGFLVRYFLEPFTLYSRCDLVLAEDHGIVFYNVALVLLCYGLPRTRGGSAPALVFSRACSAFTHVTACMLTESPMRPSTPKAPAASLPPPLLRLLPGGANQFPGGFTSRCGPPPFTAHPSTRLTGH